jgi:hypothetical protein
MLAALRNETPSYLNNSSPGVTKQSRCADSKLTRECLPWDVPPSSIACIVPCAAHPSSRHLLQALLVVESDKADMDVESFSEGILAAIATPEGERANVGAAIAFIAESEAEVCAIWRGRHNQLGRSV